MTADEKIRVTAALRTQINTAIMTLEGLAFDSDERRILADSFSSAQACLAEAIPFLNDAVQALGGRATT
jgi:hypothetical protein